MHKLSNGAVALWRKGLPWLVAVLLASRLEAQFTGNNQTNIISGTASNWSGDYHVGSNFVSNTLLVQNGGLLRNGLGYIGYATGANSNIALVTGSGSAWSNDFSFFVGYSGGGNSLVISNGGAVANAAGYIGFNSSNNSVLVTGTGSVWGNRGDLYLGNGTENSLVIRNGGHVFNSLASWGSRNNHVLVTDGGSLWRVDAQLAIDGTGHSLVISNGGVVINPTANFESVIGVNGGGNQVQVTGIGSVLSNGVVLFVGHDSTNNSLLISNGASVFSPSGYVGFKSGASNNSVRVIGSGSTWNNLGTLYVGYYGSSNNLIIGAGAAVFGQASVVGYDARATGDTVFVTDSGSVLRNANLSLGLGGIGNSLVISNGGAVVTDISNVGGGALILVTGNGSIWSNQYAFLNGNNCTVSNGGAVFSSDVNLGGPTLVTGTGSLWTASRALSLNSANALTVTNGGLIIASNTYVNYNFGAANALTIATGGRFITTNVSVSGSINIAGGNLSVSDAVGKGTFDIRTGTLVLNSGTVAADKLFVTSGSSAVTFNGGTLLSQGTAVTNGQQLYIGNGVSRAVFQLAGGIHSFNNGLHLRTNAVLSGYGAVNGLVVVDAGATVLAECGGGLTFSGSVINNGVLVANGSILDFSGLLVNNGQILLFNGGTTNMHSTFNNYGSVRDAGTVRVSNVRRVGSDAVIEVLSATGFTYRLQISSSLPTGWMDTGAAQPGGGRLMFTDFGAVTNGSARFYRTQVQ
jgi:T5SS/PEP-CTERM-associated repeat protein